MCSLFPSKTFTDAEAYKKPDNRAAKMFAGILCGLGVWGVRGGREVFYLNFLN